MGVNRYVALSGVGGVVAIAAFFLGTTIETDFFSVNARTDVVGVHSAAQLIKQDASERAIIMIARREGQTLPSYSSCAEPPPDATQEIARSISATFDALGKLSSGEQASAALGAASDLNTATEALFERSQGIQLLRDTMFRLCEAFQNGVIDPKSYAAQIESLILTANFIIPFEQCMSVARNADAIHPEVLQPIVTSCLSSAAGFNNLFVEYADRSLKTRAEIQLLEAKKDSPNSSETDPLTATTSDDLNTDDASPETE